MKTQEENNEDRQNSDNRPGFFGGMRSQWGHQGMGRAHFGQRGWLRPAILRLVQEKPMNGMEMMNQFYEASHGWWKPSPGSVYPLLETLEKEDLIRKRGDGRYEVTKKFKDGLKPEGQADEMITNMEGTISYFEDMRKSDKAKFSAYEKRIDKLRDRLNKLK